MFLEHLKKPGPDPMLDLQYRSNIRHDDKGFYTVENKHLQFRFERTKKLFLFLYENGGNENELLEANQLLQASESLEAHIDQVIRQDIGAFHDSGELLNAVRELSATLAEGKDPLAPDAPWNYEGILLAFESLGPLALNKLLYVLTDKQNGGLGYRVKKGGYGASRWDVDHDRKTITLYKNELTVPWQLRSNHSAAETLFTCVNETFFGEESTGTAVQRVGSGMLMVAGGSADIAIGVIGFLVPEPTMATKVLGGAMIATGASTFTEGASKIFHPDATGQGFNPLVEGMGAVGHAVGGEKGEAGTKMVFRATTIVVSFGGAVKILRAAQTEAGVAAQIENIRAEIQTAKIAVADEAVDTARAAEKYSYISQDAPASIQAKQAGNAELWKDAARVERDRQAAGRSVEEMNAMIKGERPLGFKSNEQYQQFVSEVQEAARKEGLNGPLVLRGSSTSFYSESPSASKPIGYFFNTGKGVKDSSDIDIAVEATELRNLVAGKGLKVENFVEGRISTKNMRELFPELSRVTAAWTKRLGRDVNPIGIIDRKATYSSPSNFIVVPKK